MAPLSRKSLRIGRLKGVRRYPVQLAQEQDGHIQFLRHELCLTGGLRHFLLPVPVLLVGLHIAELQIIQNNQVALAFALQHTCRRTHTIHARYRMVVHMDGQDTKFRSRRPHLRHFIIGELSATQMTGIYIRRSGYQPPVAQAFTLHFETVHRYMVPCGGGGTCQMQGKGRLAHGRTGGNDIQVAPLPARSQAI